MMQALQSAGPGGHEPTNDPRFTIPLRGNVGNAYSSRAFGCVQRQVWKLYTIVYATADGVCEAWYAVCLYLVLPLLKVWT